MQPAPLRYFFALSILLAPLLFSCGKDDDTEPPAPVTKDSVGAGWKAITRNENYTFLDLSFQDGAHGFAAGTVVAKTTDSGKTWQKLSLGQADPLARLSFMQFFSKERGYVLDAGVIYKTVDGGNTWTMHKYGTGQANTMFFLNEQTGFASSASGLYRTDDGAATWKQLDVKGRLVPGIFFLDSLNGWIGDMSTIQRTTDGGKTFQSQNVNTGVVFGLVFLDMDNGWAIDVKGRLWKTTDGGLNWQNIHSFKEGNTFGNLHFFDKDNGYVLYGKGIYKIANGGITITKELQLDESQSNLFADFYFTDRDHGWATTYSQLFFRFKR
ncbi:MAG: YCF48-related protein [Candidatus Pseudobacter hemicellulosilyticus]|uniref:YCF48-related protein n=1 Tax=Candidatus Pseudobacter hemicellulosilyticus TaxID=3121375 RepID=A0AAJ5WWZ0_9BACT|nr:MAG: YCF48-related protein [Pseudobacter sp.]